MIVNDGSRSKPVTISAFQIDVYPGANLMSDGFTNPTGFEVKPGVSHGIAVRDADGNFAHISDFELQQIVDQYGSD